MYLPPVSLWHVTSAKAGRFLTISFLPSVQSVKVFCCLWDFVCKQLERDVGQR